jgi:hypothetical protein
MVMSLRLPGLPTENADPALTDAQGTAVHPGFVASHGIVFAAGSAAGMTFTASTCRWTKSVDEPETGIGIAFQVYLQHKL